MPQLDFSTFPNQIFWLVLTLVALFFILDRVALPRIAGVIAARRAAITGDLASAEELKRKAEAAEAAYEAALAEARTQAQRISEETRAAIQKDLDVAIAKADAEISAMAAESEKRLTEMRAGADTAVSEVARETAEALAARIMPGLDAKAVASAIDARLKG